MNADSFVESGKTGEPGFGPGLTDPESVVLPLHYSPRTPVYSTLHWPILQEDSGQTVLFCARFGGIRTIDTRLTLV
jgi:hypothetical protein